MLNMSDFIIETGIDKLIDLLSKKRKISLSEAARILNIKESQLEAWVSTLEDRGVVDLKYPVLGEPEIVLKGILPENLKLISEKKEEKVEDVKTESTSIKTLESEEEIKKLSEKIENLEKKILEMTEEIDVTKLKEELFETLIIISSLTEIEKISHYLSLIERLVLALKAKKAWDEVDKDLMVSTLNDIAENWKEDKKEEIFKVFEEMAKKIEMI